MRKMHLMKTWRSEWDLNLLLLCPCAIGSSDVNVLNQLSTGSPALPGPEQPGSQSNQITRATKSTQRTRATQSNERTKATQINQSNPEQQEQQEQQKQAHLLLVPYRSQYLFTTLDIILVTVCERTLIKYIFA